MLRTKFSPLPEHLVRVILALSLKTFLENTVHNATGEGEGETSLLVSWLKTTKSVAKILYYKMGRFSVGNIQKHY